MSARQPVAKLTPEELIEDLTFLAESGVGMREAARRLRYAVPAIQRMLYRRDRRDLLHALRALDPTSPNTTLGAVSRYTRWAQGPVGSAVLWNAERHRAHAAETRPETAADRGLRTLALSAARCDTRAGRAA